MNPIVVGGLSIKYRRLRPKWQCYIPLPFISAGYKYELVEDYAIQTKCRTVSGKAEEIIIEGDRICKIGADGLLIIYDGYIWDGCSGPTFDSEDNMRAGLVHDSLYQLMRAKILDPRTNKEIADRLLESCMIENGASKFRAAYYYQGVHLFGGFGMGSSEPMKVVVRTRPK